MQRDMFESKRPLRAHPLAGEGGIEGQLAGVPQAVHVALTTGIDLRERVPNLAGIIRTHQARNFFSPLQEH